MSDQTEIVIASGARTHSAFNGSFSTPAHTLGAAAITAALSRADVDAGDVSKLCLVKAYRRGRHEPCPTGRHGRRRSEGTNSSWY